MEKYRKAIKTKVLRVGIALFNRVTNTYFQGLAKIFNTYCSRAMTPLALVDTLSFCPT